MKKILVCIALFIFCSSLIYAQRSSTEIVQSKVNVTNNFKSDHKNDAGKENRGTGGIYNSSAKIVIDSGTYLVVDGNYQSEGSAAISDEGTLQLTGNLVNNNTSGNPVSSLGIVNFNGSLEQQISGNPINCNSIWVNKTGDSDLVMGCDISVAGDLILTSGDLNLNGKTITMGVEAWLHEPEAGGRVYGSSGSITTTVNIDAAIEEENIANLGAEITTLETLGETTITRCHTAQYGAGGPSIQRYYDISPENNSSLNATFIFHYNEDDLNGQNESTLALWKSTDSGSTWTQMGGTRDEDENTITLSDIDSFSRWTATDGDHSLPVTLSSFTGNLENGYPTLNWITESELENLGWNIYRSEDENGLEDNSIKLNEELISGMGTVSIPTDYNYIDEIPTQQMGMHYYWLESVSYSGELEIYGPVSINLNSSNLLPNAPAKSFVNQNHPNPFNPTTTIEFGIEEGESGTLTIYNIAGQKVFSQKYEAGFHTFTWNASNQASGVYFYQLRTPSYFKTKKMIMLK